MLRGPDCAGDGGAVGGGIQRRIVEQVVGFLRNLQRTVEQDLDEMDKTIPQERILGRMGLPIGVSEIPKILC